MLQLQNRFQRASARSIALLPHAALPDFPYPGWDMDDQLVLGVPLSKRCFYETSTGFSGCLKPHISFLLDSELSWALFFFWVLFLTLGVTISYPLSLDKTLSKTWQRKTTTKSSFRAYTNQMEETV